MLLATGFLISNFTSQTVDLAGDAEDKDQDLDRQYLRRRRLG